MGKSIFDMDKTNVKVEFNIIGDTFSPDYVTQKLKINPTTVKSLQCIWILALLSFLMKYQQKLILIYTFTHSSILS